MTSFKLIYNIMQGIDSKQALSIQEVARISGKLYCQTWGVVDTLIKLECVDVKNKGNETLIILNRKGQVFFWVLQLADDITKNTDNKKIEHDLEQLILYSQSWKQEKEKGGK